MMWHIIGILAACLTTFAFVPQIIKVFKTKSVKDVSIITLIQFGVGVALWMAYGVHLENAIIITANFVSLMSVIFLIILSYRYRQKI